MSKSDDDIDNYSPSDSEDDFNENERQLLNNIRNKNEQESDSEEEVLGVGAEDSSDEDDKSDLALSDIEGQDEDDDLPDRRAWGKDKKQYYRTDYVDQDYGGFQGKDAQLAELEEEEAKNLQKQLAEQLDDEDFALEFFEKGSNKESKAEEVVKSDISKLSDRQKLQILEKESPEFFSLTNDFKEKLTVAKDYLRPVIQKFKQNEIPQSPALDFVQTHYSTILNYCLNIYMYLYLKAQKVNVQNHPVIKRLFQYRQLLLKLEPVFEKTVKSQIEILLKEGLEASELQPKSVKIKGKNKKKIQFKTSMSGNGEIAENNEEINEQSKRAITYEMAKNKGLTPYRKKELRNPRVKHRIKYRKAVIRRKGAVREPRKELSKYSGEISGIKATVTKSIKIKT